MRKKRRTYKFTERSHSKIAMVSLGFSVVTIIMYFVFVVLSFLAAGQLSVYYGAAGVFAMVVAVASLIMAIIAANEENSFAFFPRLALIASGISTFLWVGNYVNGLLRG